MATASSSSSNGGHGGGGTKVKVRKISLSVNSPARRKTSKLGGGGGGLNALPPFQWSNASTSSTMIGTKDKKECTITSTLPRVIAMSFKNSGVRKLVAQYSQVRFHSNSCITFER